MQTYTIRDKKGTMIAVVAADIADEIVDTCKGKWRKYNPSEGMPTICYEITEDSLWGMANNRNSFFKVYLWAGTKIIRNLNHKG